MNWHRIQPIKQRFLVFRSRTGARYPWTAIPARSSSSPWRYDTFVPVIFAGCGLKPQKVYRHINTVDVATTLAAWIGAKPPSGAAGQVLGEVMGQRGMNACMENPSFASMDRRRTSSTRPGSRVSSSWLSDIKNSINAANNGLDKSARKRRPRTCSPER